MTIAVDLGRKATKTKQKQRFHSCIFELCILSVEFLHPYFHTLKICTGDAGPEQSLALLDLNLSITNDIVSSKIYDKRDDFNFEINFFRFLDGDVPRYPSYGVYIPQLIRFARECSNVNDLTTEGYF